MAVPNQNAPSGAEVLVCSPTDGGCRSVGDSGLREKGKERGGFGMCLSLSVLTSIGYHSPEKSDVQFWNFP